MVKKVRKRRPKVVTRKQRSRVQQEERMRRLLILGVSLTGIAIVGVLGYGLIVEKIIKAREPVAVVGGASITTAEFQARVRFARMQMQNELRYWRRQQVMIDPTGPDTKGYLEYVQGKIRELETQLSPDNAVMVGEQALSHLIQEELVRQEAEHRGIIVTSGEVQTQIETSFGYDPGGATAEPAASATLTATGALTSTPTVTSPPTPTQMTEEDFREQYAAYLRESLKPLDISEQQYRSWLKASLLAEKLREQIAKGVPAEADQVKLRLLAVDSEDRANELAGRLDAGEDFQMLANELEEDETGTGSELSWFPRSVLESYFGEELADLAFSLDAGHHSQPVLGQAGQQYVIVEVAGHEVREVEKMVRKQLEEQAFQEWLEAQQVLVERKTYTDRVPTEP